MKKTITILAMIFFMAAPAVAINWHTGGQIPIAWDAVPKIKDTDTISYVVYTRDIKENSETIYTETDAIEATVDLNEEGEYHIGVSTKRVPLDAEILESDVIWSDDARVEYVPIPFGVRFYAKPDGPKGLVIK